MQTLRDKHAAPYGLSRPHGVLRLNTCLAVFCVLLAWSPMARSQSDDDAEYRVKLAYLYHFAQFIQWPPETFHDPAAPLTLCVAGQNPFRGEIEQELRGREVNGRPVEIKKLRPDDDPRACHMVFVPASERKQTAKILAALKGSSTLTVGETQGFADRGGIINLTLDQNKLRFEVNLDAALQTQLKISSKLLALARIVKAGRDP